MSDNKPSMREKKEYILRIDGTFEAYSLQEAKMMFWEWLDEQFEQNADDVIEEVDFD